VVIWTIDANLTFSTSNTSHQCPLLIDEIAIETATKTETDLISPLLTAAVPVPQWIDIVHHQRGKTQIETASAVEGMRRIGIGTETVGEVAGGTGVDQESGRRRDQGETKSGTRTRRSASLPLSEQLVKLV